MKLFTQGHLLPVGSIEREAQEVAQGFDHFLSLRLFVHQRGN
jgi:hypothetical protein